MNNREVDTNPRGRIEPTDSNETKHGGLDLTGVNKTEPRQGHQCVVWTARDRDSGMVGVEVDGGGSVGEVVGGQNNGLRRVWE